MKSSLLKRMLGFAVVSYCIAITPVQAAPISIDFEFSPITVSFNGVTQSTGNISMSIVTDTNTPNIGSGFSDFNNFYSADVYFTAPALVLNNTRVNMTTDLYFGSSIVGFRVTDFGTIFTAFIGPVLSFGSAFDLSTLVVPQGPIALSGTFFRTTQAITFENGSSFDSGAFVALSDRQNTVTLGFATNDVPEPGTLMLLAVGCWPVGLLAASCAARRKSA